MGSLQGEGGVCSRVGEGGWGLGAHACVRSCLRCGEAGYFAAPAAVMNGSHARVLAGCSFEMVDRVRVWGGGR